MQLFTQVIQKIISNYCLYETLTCDVRNPLWIEEKMKNLVFSKINILSGTGKCTPCLSRERTLCCKQVLTTNTFMSQQTQQITFSLTLTTLYYLYYLFKFRDTTKISLEGLKENITKIHHIRNKYGSTTQKRKQRFKKMACTRKPIKMNEVYCKRCLSGRVVK